METKNSEKQNIREKYPWTAENCLQAKQLWNCNLGVDSPPNK